MTPAQVALSPVSERLGTDQVELQALLDMAAKDGIVADMQLSGSLLRQLLCSSKLESPHGRVVLQNLEVDGPLSLDGVKVGLLLELRDCRIEDGFGLEDAQGLGLRLLGCSGGAIAARRLKLRGALVLEGCSFTRLVLDGATIGGNLALACRLGNGQQLVSEETELDAEALSADGIVVGGHGLLRGLVCEGAVRLSGARFARDLDLRSLKVRSSPQPALALDGAQITGTLRLGQVSAREATTTIIGRADCRRLSVAGDLQCVAAFFAARQGFDTDEERELAVEHPRSASDAALREWCQAQVSDAPVGCALDLDGADIRGSVSFELTHFFGQCRLTNAKVGGDLQLDGATFVHYLADHKAKIWQFAPFDASGSRIAGCVFVGASDALRGRQLCRATGPLRFASTRIDEKLLFNGIFFVRPRTAQPQRVSTADVGFRPGDVGLALPGCSVRLALRLPDDAQGARYDLSHASCGSLQEKKSSWPVASADVTLNEFRYTLSRGMLEDAWRMLELVERYHEAPAAFRPAPYRQLEAELQRIGVDALARRLARKRRGSEFRAERRELSHKLRGERRQLSLRIWSACSLLASLGRQSLLWCAGYGYSAIRAFGLSLSIVLLAGSLIAFFGGRWFVPTRAEHALSPAFDAYGFAADTFLPIIDLGFAAEYTPRPDLFVALALSMALKISGWLLSTLMVAGWSGLIKR